MIATDRIDESGWWQQRLPLPENEGGGMTSQQNETGFRRLIRMNRVASHAADLLEKEAQALLECHTIDGEWGDEIDVKAEHNDMIETARQLRALLGLIRLDQI